MIFHPNYHGNHQYHHKPIVYIKRNDHLSTRKSFGNLQENISKLNKNIEGGVCVLLAQIFNQFASARHHDVFLFSCGNCNARQPHLDMSGDTLCFVVVVSQTTTCNAL